jgi:hypothetical protein
MTQAKQHSAHYVKFHSLANYVACRYEKCHDVGCRGVQNLINTQIDFQ